MLAKTYIYPILRYVIHWTIAIWIFIFIRFYGQDIQLIFDSLKIDFFKLILYSMGISLPIGVFYGILETFFDNVRIKRISFTVLVLVKTTIQFIIFVGSIFISYYIWILFVIDDVLARKIITYYVAHNTIISIFYAYIVSVILTISKQVNFNLGPGNFWRMIKGDFFSPKEEERIVMFVDLESSTEIAEKMGHEKFSRLLQECFNDLSIVSKYNTIICKYIGDEALLTWLPQRGLKNNNAINAFFAFVNEIESKSKFYMSEFGMIPSFKAGMHIGKITIAEVGRLKREIDYHGDALNTASRIESQCKKFKRKLLISKDVFEKIHDPSQYAIEHHGEVTLAGKSDTLEIYSVSKK